jgi:excisionase family DNA binding protein
VSTPQQREILNIEEAAALVGVSVKTFNRVLHTENIPARKIGREWKFSRRALIDWVGRGRSAEFYREGSDEATTRHNVRRTRGWKIELD